MNELTPNEYAGLIATWFALENKMFQCDHCLNIFPDRKGREQVIEQEQKRKHCRGGGSFTLHGIKFNSCLGNFWDWEFAGWIKAWWQYQKGHQIFSGEWREQPAKVIQIMEIIDGLYAEKLKTEKPKNGK